ncbi:hypothetical protein CEXT_96561 [Caerostris extrusa]|uniref:Uncharacterized protein n=1 Tax=Caerostris extrusa TaxID=172846 RepID=A0AAV4SS31_CAEEX|nr:hypothetical protein CEXT_96561 [Caerostris extrusa]
MSSERRIQFSCEFPGPESPATSRCPQSGICLRNRMSKYCQKPNPVGVCGVMIVIRAPQLMDRKGFAQLMNR